MNVEEAKTIFAPQWPEPDSGIQMGSSLLMLEWHVKSFRVYLWVDSDKGVVTLKHQHLGCHMDFDNCFNVPLDSFDSSIDDPSVMRIRMSNLWDAVSPILMVGCWGSYGVTGPTDPVTRD